jgi:hypothetical protein
MHLSLAQRKALSIRLAFLQALKVDQSAHAEEVRRAIEGQVLAQADGAIAGSADAVRLDKFSAGLVAGVTGTVQAMHPHLASEPALVNFLDRVRDLSCTTCSAHGCGHICNGAEWDDVAVGSNGQ